MYLGTQCKNNPNTNAKLTGMQKGKFQKKANGKENSSKSNCKIHACEVGWKPLTVHTKKGNHNTEKQEKDTKNTNTWKRKRDKRSPKRKKETHQEQFRNLENQQFSHFLYLFCCTFRILLFSLLRFLCFS